MPADLGDFAKLTAQIQKGTMKCNCGDSVDIINFDYLSDPLRTSRGALSELERGLAVLQGVHGQAVSFFGSHRVDHKHPYYLHCRNVAKGLGREGWTVITGGGPGVMHAANAGAMSSGSSSIGLKARLLEGEDVTDPIFTSVERFDYLFVRRFILAIRSNALVFYPGGFGTLNELFEYAVLMQTGIVDRVPVVLVFEEYWRGLLDWLAYKPCQEQLLIQGAVDLDLFTLVNSERDVLKAVGNSSPA